MYKFFFLYYMIICDLLSLFDIITLILQLVSIMRGYGGHVSLTRFKGSLWLRIYGSVSVSDDEPCLHYYAWKVNNG